MFTHAGPALSFTRLYTREQPARTSRVTSAVLCVTRTASTRLLPMTTRIVFAASRGENLLTVSVEEDGQQVIDAWVAAATLPFKLTDTVTSKEVWINPATVAYWEEAQTGSASFQ